MKLDLPDDHPIAEAIRNAELEKGNRVFLTLTTFKIGGESERLMFAEINSWSKVSEPRFECTLTDPERYNRALKAMMTWSNPFIDTPDPG